MRTRFLLALPCALVLGCGAAPPPAATPDQPPTAGATAPSAAPSGGAAAASTPPLAAPRAAEAKDADKGGAASPTPSSVGRAVASDGPIVSKITQAEIIALVNGHMDLFNRCYTLGAGTSKSYNGKVTVKATVSPTGAVTAVEIVDSNTKNPKVDACVGDGFKKLTFERPKGSGATVFTFPMSFDGVVQVQ
jgi:TonB family protein